jgi:hypothetical protein
MTAPDLSERQRRIQIIAHTLFGSVIGTEDDAVTVEIPSDLSGPAASAFGASGYNAVIIGQDQRMAPRRVVNMQWRTVVDPDAQDLMTYYVYKVSLRPHAAAVETARQSPTVASITRPTPRRG